MALFRNIFYLILPVILALNAEATTTVDPNLRVDCAPRPGDHKSDCEHRGCIWDDNYDQYRPTTPLCYFPTATGYTVKSEADSKLTLAKYTTGAKNPYGTDFDELELSYKSIGKAIKVSISPKPSDKVPKRFIPPVPVDESQIQSDDQLAFTYKNDTVFSFAVQRVTNGKSPTKIWDTSIGGLLFADQYIQIATYLPSDIVYGFGENVHQQLKHDFSKYTTWTMLSYDHHTDAVNPNGLNYYGVHPFYMALEPSGKAHGVLIFNSNAQEVTTGPGPHLTYRTIGGQLDIYFFPGPTPEQVLQQYQQLLGKPYLPAYWALGFQLCRFGYKNLEEMTEIVKRQTDAQIPLDVVYVDIDLMDKWKDFGYDHENWGGFPAYVDQLHNQGMRLILLFDPAVEVDDGPFQRGIEQDASFVSWPRDDLVQTSVNGLYPLANNTRVMLGVVWPSNHSAFPDFLDPSGKTTQWWVNEFILFHKQIAFDGIWIDMNEPSNFGTNEDHPDYASFIDHPYVEPLKCPTAGDDAYLEMPPYITNGLYERETQYLCSKTLCMVGKTGRDTYNFYDTRNLYGWSETVATSEALKRSTGKRGAVISRSTFVGSGRHGGHWLGDNTATWEDLKAAIIGVQEFNLFGIPYVGADVCGFMGATTEELCIRWQQLGAFHSFYRNHNDINMPPQDPANWPSVAAVTKAANLFRYQILPYFYSLHFRASLLGGSVVRPVYYEFPMDFETHTLSHQFMLGPAIMVVPVTSPNVDSVRGYLPGGVTWYSITQAHQYGQKMSPGFSVFNAPRDTPLPAFVRGGSIIPRQKPAVTTTLSRKNPFELLVALNNVGEAQGELFWDDGESVVDKIETYNYLRFQFSVKANEQSINLDITCTVNCQLIGQFFLNKMTLPTLDTIEILGYGYPARYMTSGMAYDADKQIFRVDSPGFLNFNKNGPAWKIVLNKKPEPAANPTETLPTKTPSNGLSRISISWQIMLIAISFAVSPILCRKS